MINYVLIITSPHPPEALDPISLLSFVGFVFGAFSRFATDFDHCKIFRNHSAASVCPRATNLKFVELDVYQTKSWTPDYLTLAYKIVCSLLFRIVCMSVFKVKFDAPTQAFGDWPALVFCSSRSSKVVIIGRCLSRGRKVSFSCRWGQDFPKTSTKLT
jgi:hypothetical protein